MAGTATALDVSSFLTSGADYTFSFSPSVGSILDSAFSSDLSSLFSPLQFVSRISNVTVKQAPGLSLQLNVSFVYTGDGSDTVANAIQWILDAWASTQLFGTYDFVGATGGPAPIATGGSDALTSGISSAISSVIPTSSSGLWAIVLILVIVAFLMSGGSAFLKRVL
jgi:hypothetical protein